MTTTETKLDMEGKKNHPMREDDQIIFINDTKEKQGAKKSGKHTDNLNYKE